MIIRIMMNLLWPSGKIIRLLLECVAIDMNANDIDAIANIDAIASVHGIITDCLLFDPMQVVLLYFGGGCWWSLIFICMLGFYVSWRRVQKKDGVTTTKELFLDSDS